MLTAFLILAMFVSLYAAILSGMFLGFAVSDSKTPSGLCMFVFVQLVLSILSTVGLGIAIAMINR